MSNPDLPATNTFNELKPLECTYNGTTLKVIVIRDFLACLLNIKDLNKASYIQGIVSHNTVLENRWIINDEGVHKRHFAFYKETQRNFFNGTDVGDFSPLPAKESTLASFGVATARRYIRATQVCTQKLKKLGTQLSAGHYRKAAVDFDEWCKVYNDVHENGVVDEFAEHPLSVLLTKEDEIWKGEKNATIVHAETMTKKSAATATTKKRTRADEKDDDSGESDGDEDDSSYTQSTSAEDEVFEDDWESSENDGAQEKSTTKTRTSGARTSPPKRFSNRSTGKPSAAKKQKMQSEDDDDVVIKECEPDTHYREVRDVVLRKVKEPMRDVEQRALDKALARGRFNTLSSTTKSNLFDYLVSELSINDEFVNMYKDFQRIAAEVEKVQNDVLSSLHFALERREQPLILQGLLYSNHEIAMSLYKSMLVHNPLVNCEEAADAVAPAPAISAAQEYVRSPPHSSPAATVRSPSPVRAPPPEPVNLPPAQPMTYAEKVDKLVRDGETKETSKIYAVLQQREANKEMRAHVDAMARRRAAEAEKAASAAAADVYRFATIAPDSGLSEKETAQVYAQQEIRKDFVEKKKRASASPSASASASAPADAMPASKARGKSLAIAEAEDRAERDMSPSKSQETTTATTAHALSGDGLFVAKAVAPVKGTKATVATLGASVDRMQQITHGFEKIMASALQQMKDSAQMSEKSVTVGGNGK